MELVLIVVAFLLSFFIVLISVPPIVRVSNAKKLFDAFEKRKIHTRLVPPLGGVAIFLGFTLSSIVATDGYTFDSLKYIMASVIMMFFIGLKDDLLVISPRKKFIVQIFAAVLLITLGNVHITNVHGLLGIYAVNESVSILLSLFVMLAIVNGFNLIDGIDGLASGFAMMLSVIFGTWFFLAGHVQFAIMSFALTGSLAGFFLFNVFGTRNKLFMGDAGALMVGLVMSTIVIKFNEFNMINTSAYFIDAAPAVAFATLSLPLLDTLRVIIVRLLNHKSPFIADRNHTHHRLLELIPSHFKVTVVLVCGNLSLVGLALWVNYTSLNINIQLLLIFLTGIFLALVPSVILRIKRAGKMNIRSIMLKQYSEF